MPEKIDNSVPAFIKLLSINLAEKKWDKLVLSKYRGPEADLQRISIRVLTLREELKLSFIYRYQTREITENLSDKEGLDKIQLLLTSDFKSAHFFAETTESQCDISKKGKVRLITRTIQPKKIESTSHDREKQRYVDISREFLVALGVTDQQHQLIPSMAKKWKQINKFIEIFSQAFSDAGLNEVAKQNVQRKIQVVDFGSGKGYLTFALHDYIRQQLQLNCQVSGVELRQSLTDLCNSVAQKLNYLDLSFVCGDVKTHAPKQTDVMIALHACDIATDYAIHYGIQANASIIMCSPCCHKQIRPQMQSPSVLKPLLQYGVHLGQEAEMVTDSLRALILEANGYATKVFEFVSLEHTNKNKMILAIKKNRMNNNQAIIQQINQLKKFYGVTEHCLETLLQQSTKP